MRSFTTFLIKILFKALISFSIEDISTIKRKPFGQKKKSPSENQQSHHQSNMSLTESDFISQAFGGGAGGRISRSNSSNQIGCTRTDSPKVCLYLCFNCLIEMKISQITACQNRFK